MEATSVGCTARARLGGEGEGVIHGVFDGAINVGLLRGFVCLVPEAVERGRLNITLKLPARASKMSSLGARTGGKVKVRGGRLELCDGYRIAFRRAPIYWPKREFTSSMLEDEEIAGNAEVVRKTALRFGRKAGLGGLLSLLGPVAGPPATRRLNIFASAAVPRIIRLEQAFRSEDGSLMGDAVGELVGLGPGLTPSSDDMLWASFFCASSTRGAAGHCLGPAGSSRRLPPSGHRAGQQRLARNASGRRLWEEAMSR